MTSGEGLLSGSLGVVLTDLFIAATAAIIMLLAVLRNTPDIPLPVQADFILSCGADREFLLSLPQSEMPPVVVSDPRGLATAVRALADTPRLFQTIALVPGAEGLSARCLDRVQSAVRLWNLSLGTSAEGTEAVVLGLAVVAREQEAGR